MAAIRQTTKTRAKKAGGKRKSAPQDEVAALRAQLDAAVDDYEETIRLLKLYFKATKRNPQRRRPGEQPAWKAIVRLGERIPPEELANFPKDGARNLDHYLYGSPKVDES